MKMYFQTKPELDIPVIVKLLCLTLSSIIPLLVICNALEELHTRFEEIDIFQQCKWYRYPIKIRRALPIIIVYSQNLNFIKVFGDITASRETCQRVIQINIEWLKE